MYGTPRQNIRTSRQIRMLKHKHEHEHEHMHMHMQVHVPPGRWRNAVSTPARPPSSGPPRTRRRGSARGRPASAPRAAAGLWEVCPAGPQYGRRWRPAAAVGPERPPSCRAASSQPPARRGGLRTRCRQSQPYASPAPSARDQWPPAGRPQPPAPLWEARGASAARRPDCTGPEAPDRSPSRPEAQRPGTSGARSAASPPCWRRGRPSRRRTLRPRGRSPPPASAQSRRGPTGRCPCSPSPCSRGSRQTGARRSTSRR
mmetsp:Transcript_60243/g.186476  ORF Transcript_60243/g.186476 Transcript_60243/m.186476 type:complete len:258 (-) Transcript_60243:241-1014(-)